MIDDCNLATFVMFFKDDVLAIIHRRNSGTEGEIAATVCFTVGTDLVTLEIFFCAAGLKTCAKRPCF